MDLTQPGQGVHDDHFLFGLLHQLGSDLVEVSHFLVLGEVGEALLLNPRDVEHIRGGDYVGNVIGFADGDVLVAQFVGLIQGQAKDLRRDKVYLHVVHTQQPSEGVHRAPILQVTHHGHPQAINVSQFLLDGEQVQQGLGGVLASAVAGIDNRHTGVVGGDFR